MGLTNDEKDEGNTVRATTTVSPLSACLTLSMAPCSPEEAQYCNDVPTNSTQGEAELQRSEVTCQRTHSHKWRSRIQTLISIPVLTVFIQARPKTVL